MLKPFSGRAVAVVGSWRRDVDVSFDLHRGACVISGEAKSDGLGDLGMRLALSKKVFLEEVRVRSPLGLLYARKLGPFFSSYVQAGPSEDGRVASSILAKLLGAESLTAEVDEILLTPQRSEIRLELEGLPINADSEAFFYCGSSKDVDCSISRGARRVEVHSFGLGSPLSGYVRCASSDVMLGEHLNELRVALSLFFRQRSFVHLVRDGGSIAINLAARDSALSYGLLVTSPVNADEVLQKLVDYAPLSQPYFLIEAFSNPGALEVRLLNAFVHLEIVDRGRTLSANQLATVFGIARESADVIVQVRNAMIHDGLNIQQALRRLQNRIPSRDGAPGARILQQITASASPHGEFYGALMDLLSTHLARQAKIPLEWIARRVTTSFFEDPNP